MKANIRPLPRLPPWEVRHQLPNVLNERETTRTMAGVTAQPMAEAPKFSLLSRCMEEAAAERRDEARRALSTLVDRLDVDSAPEDMQHLLFAAAIARRLGGD